MKRPQASIASELLSQEITVQATKTKAIQEALEEAKREVFISQESMEAWVDSLGTNNELPFPTPDIFYK